MVDLPRGVVLDKPMLHALLYAGVAEGLLDDNPAVGDGFVRHLMSSQPSKELLTNAYEHLVLGGQIIAPFRLPLEWRGELFERGFVIPQKSENDESLVKIPGLSPDIILPMLRDRGIAWSLANLQDRYNTFLDAYNDWEEKGAKSFEGMELRTILRPILGIPPEDGTDEEMATWNKLQKAYAALKPVLACDEDYRQVLTSSFQCGALSALPVDSLAASEMPIPSQVIATEERRSLLRIVCKRLRRVAVGGTLKETMALAASPEAEALRDKLATWSDAIRKNQADPAIAVLDEVERACASLRTSRTLTKVGNYSTIIGVPLSVVGLFTAGPLVAIGGLAVSVIGGIALGGQQLIERANRWAMYGQE